MEKFEVFFREVKTVVFGYLKFVIWESGESGIWCKWWVRQFSAAKKVGEDESIRNYVKMEWLRLGSVQCWYVGNGDVTWLLPNTLMFMPSAIMKCFVFLYLTCLNAVLVLFLDFYSSVLLFRWASWVVA